MRSPRLQARSNLPPLAYAVPLICAAQAACSGPIEVETTHARVGEAIQPAHVVGSERSEDAVVPWAATSIEKMAAPAAAVARAGAAAGCSVGAGPADDLLGRAIGATALLATLARALRRLFGGGSGSTRAGRRSTARRGARSTT